MNKGLPANFILQRGRFLLSSGVEKTRDSVNFYCRFEKRRTYLSDYGKNSVSLLRSLIQKPISYIQRNSTLIFGIMQKDLQKYVPGVKVRDIDLGYFPENRRQYLIKIEYTSIQDDKSEIDDVIFV